MKTLITYCYYETEKTQDNFSFFLKNGVIQSENYDYIFIINNHTCSVQFPDYDNIKIIKHDNDNDVSSYKWLIETYGDEYFLKYNYFYFINSSCIGPFLPPIITNNWIELMNVYLNKYDLIGPVVEIPPDNTGFLLLDIPKNENIPFIHTYMFGVSVFGFKIFKELLHKNVTISKHRSLDMERMISSGILTNGGKIKSFLKKFQHVDLNNEANWNYYKFNQFNNTRYSCYEIPKNYFGLDLNPFEIIFVKNLRNASEYRKSDISGISSELYLQVEKYKNWTNNNHS